MRSLCLQYGLPHPLILLENPLTKYRFKKLVKLKVSEYWHQVLSSECTSPSLRSLRYFNPARASLQHPHPLWTTAAGNSFECSKSTILARMISGRYRTEMLCRFWSTNRSGYCLSPTCHQVDGDLEHLLIGCPALEHIRSRLHSLWCLKTVDCPPLHNLILSVLGSDPVTQVMFILDSTSWPQIVNLVQVFGQEVLEIVLYLTRTWAFSIHKHKLKLLGRWPETRASSTFPSNDQTPNIDNDSNDNPQLASKAAVSLFPNSFSNDLNLAGSASEVQGATPPATVQETSTAPAPTGCTTTISCSSTTLPATSTQVQCDAESFVPEIPTIVQCDLPTEAMPGPINLTTLHRTQSVNCVVELDKNLTGRGRGHGVTDCSPSGDAGHQQPGSQNLSAFLSLHLSRQCSQH